MCKMHSPPPRCIRVMTNSGFPPHMLSHASTSSSATSVAKLLRWARRRARRRDSLAAAHVALHRHIEVAAQDHLLVRTTEYEVLDAPLLLDKDAAAAG
jgi:hypothetical protein